MCMMDREGCGNFNSGNSLGPKCAVARVTRSVSSRTGRGTVGQKTGRIRDINTVWRVNSSGMSEHGAK